MMVKVKICGIKDPEHVKLLINIGVDAIGVVVNVPKSPRNLSIKNAQEIRTLIPPFIAFTCVTIGDSVSDVLKLEDEIRPDVIQVHSLKEESFFKELRFKLKTKLILGLPIDEDGYSKVISKDPIEACNVLSKYCDALLIDSFSKKTIGGSGRLNNIKIAKKVRNAIKIPLILSGGLNDQNVKEAIQYVVPFAVDVSSGVESSPGIKDENLILQFMKQAKEVV